MALFVNITKHELQNNLMKKCKEHARKEINATWQNFTPS